MKDVDIIRQGLSMPVSGATLFCHPPPHTPPVLPAEKEKTYRLKRANICFSAGNFQGGGLYVEERPYNQSPAAQALIGQKILLRRKKH